MRATQGTGQKVACFGAGIAAGVLAALSPAATTSAWADPVGGSSPAVVDVVGPPAGVVAGRLRGAGHTPAATPQDSAGTWSAAGATWG
jgi:hypothetical protein